MKGQNIRFLSILLAAALALAACSDADSAPEISAEPVTTSAPAETTTTTTAAPETTTTTTDIPSDAPLVIASDEMDPEAVERLAEEVAELIQATEDVRGLPFLTQPMVTILTRDELEARVRADIEEELDEEELAIEERVLQLFGLLEADDDLDQILLDLYGEQVAGFYDGDTGELVIAGDAAELSPYTKTVVVHELVHALTDQHFFFHDDYVEMWEEERYEEGAAFQALIEGDATYFQLIYMQEMPIAEQLALATEAMRLLQDSSSTASIPSWLLTDLSFPYESGQVFVERLIDEGGIAAVDDAYENRPVSTEVVMHPSRYLGGEMVLDVPAVEITLEGFETYESSSYGEWGFRLLLGQTAAAGVAAESANGWGGDSYQVLHDEDDIVFALAFKGDSEDDAFELADALITMVAETLEMGEPLGDGGGVSFNAEDGRYAYLDRIGDGFIFVLSTDSAAGESAVDQMTVP